LKNSENRKEIAQLKMSYLNGPWQNELRCDLKKHSWLALSFPLIFILRRLAMVALIFYLIDYPFFQLVCVTTLNFWMLTYLIWVKPFKTFARNMTEILNEACIYVLSVLMLAFQAG
jgi:hypothetical protein